MQTNMKLKPYKERDMQVAVNKEIGYVFPTKSSDMENYQKLENLLIGTKYWEAASSINSAQVGTIANRRRN